jgi:hypothetical protein
MGNAKRNVACFILPDQARDLPRDRICMLL